MPACGHAVDGKTCSARSNLQTLLEQAAVPAETKAGRESQLDALSDALDVSL